MKKMFALMMTLCLLCAACSALADTEIPTWESMPLAVYDDENTTVEESAFQGEWVLNVAFAGTEYIDNETLGDKYDYDFVPYVIADGKISKDVESGEGEFHTIEMPYTFEAGQLQGQDDKGRVFAVDLLEDGNIAMATFFPGEGDETICVTVFMVHPEQEQ